MAKIVFTGLEQYAEQIAKMANKTDAIVDAALYEGAKVVHEAIIQEVDTVSQLTPVQKEGLKQGCGVARFDRSSGTTHTKIGFTGYNAERTKKWPSGKPNIMIARTICRGNSFTHADDFVKRAVSKSKAASIKAMGDEVEKRIKLYSNL